MPAADTPHRTPLQGYRGKRLLRSLHKDGFKSSPRVESNKEGMFQNPARPLTVDSKGAGVVNYGRFIGYGDERAAPSSFIGISKKLSTNKKDGNDR